MVAFALLPSRDPIGQSLHISGTIARSHVLTTLGGSRRIEMVTQLLRIKWTTGFTSQLENLVSARLPVEGAVRRKLNTDSVPTSTSTSLGS